MWGPIKSFVQSLGGSINLKLHFKAIKEDLCRFDAVPLTCTFDSRALCPLNICHK